MILKEFNLPGEARAKTRIHKKQLYENGDLSKVEKELIKRDVEKIVWEFTLKSTNINNDEYKVYFVIETKGTTEEFGRKGKENYKINCAKLHFEALNKDRTDKIIYEVAKSHEDLEKQVLKQLEKVN